MNRSLTDFLSYCLSAFLILCLPGSLFPMSASIVPCLPTPVPPWFPASLCPCLPGSLPPYACLASGFLSSYATASLVPCLPTPVPLSYLPPWFPVFLRPCLPGSLPPYACDTLVICLPDSLSSYARASLRPCLPGSLHLTLVPCLHTSVPPWSYPHASLFPAPLLHMPLTSKKKRITQIFRL
jgi:hypothetical protein